MDISADSMMIKSGKYEVLWSGSVIQFENEPVEFIFKNPDGTYMTMKMVFERDDKDPSNRLTFGEVTASHAEFRMINNINAVGDGNPYPIDIGSYYRRRLFFSYRIYALTPETSKLIHYTWYLGEETDK